MFHLKCRISIEFRLDLIESEVYCNSKGTVLKGSKFRSCIGMHDHEQ